jgi:hypothetical protein
MASILPRKNKDGTTSWRVWFRRKGLPAFCTAFVSKKEAEEFVKDCEWKYIQGTLTRDKLHDIREREFHRRYPDLDP